MKMKMPQQSLPNQIESPDLTIIKMKVHQETWRKKVSEEMKEMREHIDNLKNATEENKEKIFKHKEESKKDSVLLRLVLWTAILAFTAAAGYRISITIETYISEPLVS